MEELFSRNRRITLSNIQSRLKELEKDGYRRADVFVASALLWAISDNEKYNTDSYVCHKLHELIEGLEEIEEWAREEYSKQHGRIRILLIHKEKNGRTCPQIRLFGYKDLDLYGKNERITYFDNLKTFSLNDKKNGLNLSDNASWDEIHQKYKGFSFFDLSLDCEKDLEIIKKSNYTIKEFKIIQQIIKQNPEYNLLTGVPQYNLLTRHALVQFQNLVNERLRKCCCTTNIPEKECEK